MKEVGLKILVVYILFRMDGQCEGSIRYNGDVSGIRKKDCVR